MERSISRDVRDGSSTLDDDGDLVSCGMAETMGGKEKEERSALSCALLSSP